MAARDTPHAVSEADGEGVVRSPLVWENLDQRQLDDAYDQSIYAPNAEQIAERRKSANRDALRFLKPPLREAYGPSEIEKVDIYTTDRSNAPLFVFIHGGAWRGGVSSQWAYMAEPFVRAGAHFVAVDFINILDSAGDLFPMVDQIQRALAWVFNNASAFRGDPMRIFAGGHSSGSHLCGCAMVADWKTRGLPENMIKGALLSSGMYDLRPVRLSKRSEYVQFTDRMVEELSPLNHIEKVRAPLVLTYGTCESPEFQRQAQVFHQALTKAGKAAELRVGRGYNHFEIQETLGNPYGLLGRSALSLMGLR